MPKKNRSTRKIKLTLPLILTFTLGVITILIISFFAIYQSQNNAPKASSSAVSLLFNPNTKTIGVNQTATVDLIINTNNMSLAAVDLTLSYSPELIEITEFKPSTTLPNVLSAIKIENGTVKVALGSDLSKAFVGSGIIGSITIKSKTSKATTLAVTLDSQAAILGQDSNALGNRPTLTINSANPTPKPSRKPTPRPLPIERNIPIPSVRPQPVNK